jgi:DNA-binding MarR family transcriptional regulator
VAAEAKAQKAAKSPKTAAKEQMPINAASFGDITMGMAKLLARLEDFGPFREMPISVAEWSALLVLSNGEVDTMKGIGRELGLPKQRAAQLGELLKRSGYVSVVSDSGDIREDQLVLTESGKERLTVVDQSLTPTLLQGLEGKEKTLSSVRKSLKTLVKLMSTAEPKDDGRIIAKQAKAAKVKDKPSNKDKKNKSKAAADDSDE